MGIHKDISNRAAKATVYSGECLFKGCERRATKGRWCDRHSAEESRRREVRSAGYWRRICERFVFGRFAYALRRLGLSYKRFRKPYCATCSHRVSIQISGLWCPWCGVSVDASAARASKRRDSSPSGSKAALRTNMSAAVPSSGAQVPTKASPVSPAHEGSANSGEITSGAVLEESVVDEIVIVAATRRIRRRVQIGFRKGGSK